MVLEEQMAVTQEGVQKDAAPIVRLEKCILSANTGGTILYLEIPLLTFDHVELAQGAD